MCHDKQGVKRTLCHCHKVMVLSIGFEDGPYNNHEACIAAALDVKMTSLQVYIGLCATRDTRKIASHSENYEAPTIGAQNGNLPNEAPKAQRNSSALRSSQLSRIILCILTYHRLSRHLPQALPQA